jgi:hypothetical protein
LLPEGYSKDDKITCLTSPHVLVDGLIFCPADKIDELDGASPTVSPLGVS